MTKALKDTLKDIQILLGKPGKKIAGALKYYLDFLNVSEPEQKEPEIVKDSEKIYTLKHGKVTWVDVRNPTRKEVAKLAEKYPFHPLHLEDCISKGQFPKIEQSEEDKYIFILLRFPRYSAQEERIIINQICFFLGLDYLVTIHENKSDIISNIFSACKANSRQKEAYIQNSSAHLLYTIMEQLTDDFTPLLQKLLKDVDDTEDVVFDDRVSGVYKIGQLRREIISLRRVIGPLRVLLADLVKRVNKFTGRNFTVYFEDIIHRVEKVWETLEEARETVDVYKDADFTIGNEKTNRILAVLTIIFTLTIPITVVGTVYGMNILLPGGIESGNWLFWGEYTTFILLMGSVAIPALIMLVYFRSRGWF